jgi:hypothetical protein
VPVGPSKLYEYRHVCGGERQSVSGLSKDVIVGGHPAGGDKQTAAELSQMKGQMVAVEQASIAKKCNIQFQGKPPGS